MIAHHETGISELLKGVRHGMSFTLLQFVLRGLPVLLLANINVLRAPKILEVLHII